MEHRVTHSNSNGIVAAIAACLIWGLTPIFYRQLAHVPPLEIMLHRVIWSFVLFGLVLAVQRRLGEVKGLLTDRAQVGKVALATLAISVNWFLFIYAVAIDRLSESSLGYYIAPLFSVLIGFIVFREHLSTIKWLAVAMATVAVLILTVGLGAAPWISLALSSTFAIYGAVKKTMGADSLVSVTAEAALMVPLAVCGVLFLSETRLTFDLTLVLLMLSGLLTAGPLMLYSYAAKHMRLASLGVVSYVNPTLQFLVAWMIFGELLTIWHAIAFPLIWLALVLYSGASLASERKRSARASTEGTL